MEHSVRGVRQRGEGTWQARILHRDTAKGESKTTYHTIKAKSEKQANRKAEDIVADMYATGFVIESNMKLCEFLEGFLEHKKDSRTVESSTIKGYKVLLRTITRYMGTVMLNELTTDIIERWMSEMCADGYSPKTISKCFIFLKQALNYGVSQEVVRKNPCAFCSPPKRLKTPINALTREERSRMLDLARQAQPEPLAVAIELMLTTGMRRGEVCALRWFDFDADKRTITVSHSLGSGEGGFYVKEPKTGKERTIPLTEHSYNLLFDMKEEVDSLAKKFKFKGDNSFILGVPGVESRPYNPTLMTRNFQAFCRMNGFDCTLHDLRHTFATFLIADGVDVVTVANYLGHAKPSMTLDIYADVDPEAKLRAVGRIEEAFDDAWSVFKRTAAARREELAERAEELGLESDNGSSSEREAAAERISDLIVELQNAFASLEKAN